MLQDAFEGETLVHEENAEVVTNKLEDIKLANEKSTVAGSEKQKHGGDKRQGLGSVLDCTITVCPKSLDPFHILSYFISLVETSWTYSIPNCIRFRL